jgi:hypothetical protein
MVADKIMNHSTYPKMLRSKDESSLRFIIKDAKEAIEANPTNPNNSYYADEVIYAAAELRRRGL